MLAVIVTGGKQYKVSKDQVIQVEKLDAQEGDSIQFDKVVLLQDGKKVLVGSDTDKATVSATVLTHLKGTKINVVKFKRRKRYLRQQGHRQQYTKVKIEEIQSKPAAKKAAAAKKTKAKSEE